MNTRTNTVAICIGALLVLASAPVSAQDDSEESTKTKETSSADSSQSDSGSAASNGKLKVVDAKMCSKVKEREPVDSGTSFETGETVTVWMAVRNPDSPTNVEAVWKRDGREIHSYDLNVGKSWRWRTWARLKPNAAGDWSVEIQDSNGNKLETVEFKVK